MIWRILYNMRSWELIEGGLGWVVGGGGGAM